MKPVKTTILALTLSLVAASAFADATVQKPAQTSQEDVNFMDELDPFDPNIEQKLLEMDKAYEAETGKSAIQYDFSNLWSSCTRINCAVYLDISKAEQKAQLFVNGVLVGEYLVSTGVSGHSTPDFDTHPNGRIYDRYTSKKWPGGDYVDDNGTKLGNMPYAVFIRGGFAVHGTGRGNWKKLGKRASHGCIRMHPDNGKYFNRLVRSYGVRNTWIRVR